MVNRMNFPFINVLVITILLDIMKFSQEPEISLYRESTVYTYKATIHLRQSCGHPVHVSRIKPLNGMPHNSEQLEVLLLI